MHITSALADRHVCYQEKSQMTETVRTLHKRVGGCLIADDDRAEDDKGPLSIYSNELCKKLQKQNGFNAVISFFLIFNVLIYF